MANDIHREILRIGIAFFDSPKLIKTVLGFLTNVNALGSLS